MKKFYVFLLAIFLSSFSFAQHCVDAGFNPNDLGFDIGLAADNGVTEAAVQSNGKIVIAGSFSQYNGTTRRSIARLDTDGRLDLSFNAGLGTTITVDALAIQSDGKILIGGTFTNYLSSGISRIVRLNSDGTLDATFNSGGSGANTGSVFSIAIQPDGKILIGGSFTSYNGTSVTRVARLNTNGTLDLGFSTGATHPNNTVNSIALQADGKILIGGSFTAYNGTLNNRLVRLYANGTHDTGFNNGGAGAANTVNDIAFQNDKLIITGSFTTYNGVTRRSIARIDTTNGSLDASFDAGLGAAITINSLAIQPDLKILIGGTFTNYLSSGINRLVRLNSNGAHDTGFNSGGAGAGNTVNSIALQPDGKVIIGGVFTDYNSTTRNRITRLEATGSLDMTFNIWTAANGEIRAIAVQPDGKILIGGNFTTYDGVSRNRIARLNTDGSLDLTFNPGAGATGGTVETITLQPDGKILIGGSFTQYNFIARNRITRLNSDGTDDAAFIGSGANGIVRSIVIQPDNKILIGGDFTTYNGSSGINRVTRINSTGTLDGLSGTGAGNSVYSIALQSDGKIIIGGAFTSYNGTTGINRIARLNSDGTLDGTFSTGSGANSTVNKIVLQPDNKILIGGDFTSYNGTSGRNRFIRLNSDGTFDATFTGTGANGTVNAVALQPDGKIFIGGGFTTYTGTDRNRIARVNSDGTLDLCFNPGTGFPNTVNAIALSGNKTIIGGLFTSYNGIGRNRIVQLKTCDETKLTKSCLNYGSVIVTVQKQDSLYIKNPTCNTLTVFNITKSLPQYTLNTASSFTVAAYDSAKVKVTFLPTSPAVYLDTLRIFNSLANTFVCLSGTGIPAPVISVNPNPLNVALGCTDSTVVPLSITNSGGSNLTFSITGQDGFCGIGGGGSTRVAVYNNATIAAMLNTQPDITATAVSTYNAASLTNYDVLMNIRSSNLNQSDVLNWINNGGTWIGEWSSNTIPVSTWNAITGTSGVSTSGSMSVIINQPSHYLAQNINWASMPVGADPCDYMYDIDLTDPAATTIISVNHSSFGVNPLLVEKKYGKGKIILFNWDYQDNPNYNAVVQDLIQEVVRYGGKKIGWICPVATSGTVTPSATFTVNVNFNSTGLAAGTYTTSLAIASNDPATPVVNVPCTLTVSGNENINIPLSDTCPRFDTIMAFTTDAGMITIYNLGCDTLFISTIISSSSDFIVGGYPSKISPFDSAFVNFIFAPTSPGNKTTTITVQNSDTDTTFCLQGYAFPPPVLSVSPAALTTTLTCIDSTTAALTINNTGDTNLTYNITIQNPTFGSSLPLPAACTPTTTAYCCGMGIYNVTLNTINNTTPDGSQGYKDYTATQSTILIPGQTYTLSVRTGASYNEYAEAWIDFNDDGTFQASEQVMNDLNTLPNTIHTATFTVPLSASKNSTVRMRVTSDYQFQPIPGPCTNPYYGQAEDYTIHLLAWVAAAPTSGTVTPSSSNTVTVTFNSTGMTVGTYTANLVISGNDPVNTSDTVLTTLVVTGAGNFTFAGFGDTIASSCLYLDSIMVYTSNFNEIHIANSGCDTLWIDSVKFSPAVFSLDSFTAYILPGDTGGVAVLFSPTVTGTYNGTVTVYTNDIDTSFCLKGYAFPPPVMSHYPSSFTVTVNCTDTVIDTLIVKNTGGSDLFIDVSTYGRAKINAALVHADYVTWVPDVQSKLMATGKFNLVDILDARFSTPTLAQLQAYDAILVWSDWSFNNATLLGDRVADYLDGGGGVVVAMGALADWGQLQGRFNTDDYWCIDPSPDIWGSAATLGTVFNPGHPVMAGVTSFNGGSGSWRPGTFAVDPVATRIADWSDGHPLVAIRTINGSRRVDLGMWPISDDAYSGSWLPSTNGALLMANALHYSSTAGEPWLAVAPAQDTAAAGDSSIIQVTFNSSGLLAGTYTTNIVVNGNDPLNPTDTIPVTLVVNGVADFEFAGFADTIPTMCLDLDSIMEYTTSTDTVFITNLGCDTLWLDSIKFSPAVFSLNTASAFILPGDTSGFVVLFSPVSTGTITGTASLFTNDIDTVFCLKGIAFPRPVISFNPDTVLATLACCDSVTIPVTVSNSGGSDLIFNIFSNQNFIEDFESGLGKWVTGGPQGANWTTVTDPYTGAFSLKQSAANYGDGWYQYIQLAQNLKVTDAANCNLSFWEKRAMECCCDYLRAQISVNGGPFITLYSVNCIQAAWNQQNFPLTSYVSNGDLLMVRFEFTTDGLVTSTGVNIDDISITGVSMHPHWLTIPLNGDTISPANSTIVNFEITSCGLLVGTHTANVVVLSNDPLNSLDTIPVILTVTGAPVFTFLGLGDTIAPQCLDMDTIMVFTSSMDSVLFTNTGCDTLFVSVATSANFFVDSLSVDSTWGYLLPGDTVWLPVFFAPTYTGTVAGTISIYTNDIDTVICVKGYAYPQPVICHSPDTFFITIPVCEDTVSGQLQICNSGGSNLTWNIYSQTNVCDDFDPGIDGSVWSVNTGIANTNCGPFSGNGLWFGNAGTREAATVDMNTLAGGTISFYIKLPQTGGLPCEAADNAGENVVLEYSNNGASGPWITIADYTYNAYPNLVLINQAIPAGAKTSATRFRWRQLGHSGTSYDHWILDNVCVTTGSANVIATPSTGTTVPTGTTTVTMQFTNNGLAGGTYNIPVFVNSNDPLNTWDTVIVMLTIDTVGPVKPVANDTFVCAGNPTPPLIATVTPGDTIKWYDNPSLTNLVFTGNPFVPTQTAVGTYVYYVTATDTVYGCESVADIATLTINPPPSAPTAGGNSPACTGQNLSLTASNISGATYSWSGPNSFTASTQNPIIFSVTTAAAGTYSVIVTVAGCPASGAGTVTIAVNQTPASPSASANTPICTGNNLSLTASTVGGSTYNWTGPNSFTSTNQNPVIVSATTAASGNYSVTATENGCTSPAGTVSVTVNPVPGAPAAGFVSPACTGQTLSLTSNTIAGATYSWSGPNGFTSSLEDPTIASVTTAASGTYSVFVVVSGCTSPTGTVSVTVNVTPSAPVASSSSPVCSGTTLSLSATAGGSPTYNWSGPNGFTSGAQNPTIGGISTLGNGTYSVTATENGCTGPAGTTSVVVNQTPSAPVAGSNSPICVGQDISLTASTLAGVTYNWTGPNSFTSTQQNPVIAGAAIADGGTYSVTATANGCTGPAGTTNVTVNPPPAAPVAGSNSPVCSGTTLSLTASSTGVSYSWTGPNGFTSTLQNPTIGSVTTLGNGTYSVVAINGGCPPSAAGTTSVTVYQTPSAPIVSSNSPVCVGNNISLTATPTIAPVKHVVNVSDFAFAPVSFNAVVGDTVEWVWVNGNHTTTSTTIPGGAAAWNNPINSSNTSFKYKITVAGTYSYQCTPHSGMMTASFTVTDPLSYNWNGPNSFTSTSQNPVIASAGTVNSGTYSVTVMQNGCTGPAGTTSVTVNPSPTTPAAGSNSPVCSGQTLSLTASNSGTTYNWSGPNSFTSTVQNPTIGSVTTLASGTYSVTASTPGCLTSAAGTTVVTINQTPSAPVASSNAPICSGTDLSLTASIVGGSTYNWTGPNAFTSTSQNPVIVGATTAASGNYSVTATENGCTGPAGTVSVTVNPPPAVPTASSNSPVCSGQTLNLTASTISGVTYSWTGPNSFTSTIQNPTIGSVTTLASGTYSVFAIAAGCPPSVAGTVSVTINPSPAAPVAGSNSPICAGLDLSLTANTVGGSAYNWSGPGGFTSTSQNPVIIAAAATASGTYSVTATEFGCTGPAGTVSVTVYPIPTAPSVGNNTPVCVGSDVSLTATAGGGASYNWSGPNGFTATAQNPVIVAAGTADAGTYSVSATENGCTGPVGTTTVVVNTTPSVPAAGANTPVCSGQVLSLTASNAGSGYSWNGPNGFTSSLQNPFILGITTAGSGTYSVVAINAGCPPSGTGTVSVTVNQTPGAPTVSANSPICAGNNLSLTASTVGGSTYNWIGPNSFTSTNQNPVIIAATTAEIGTYTVIATEFGCTGPAATVSVTVFPIPASPVAGSNSPVCEGQTLSLTASTVGGATYSWSGPNGFSSNGQNPLLGSVTSASAGTYSVTASENGCTSPVATASVTVNPLPASPVASPAADTVCFGSANPVFNAAGTTIEWWSDAALTVLEFSGTAFTPTVTAAGTYTYYVTESLLGCKSIPDTITLVISSTSALAVNDTVVTFGSPAVVLSASGTNVQWYNSSMTLVGSGATYNTGQTAVGTYTYYVTQTMSGCESAPDMVVLTIAPSAPLAVNDTVCFGQPVPDLTASGTGLKWYSDASLSTLVFSGNPFPTGQTAPGTYTYYVTQTVNNVESASDTVFLVINPLPAAPASADQSACFGGTIPNLIASGTSVQWYNSAMALVGSGNSFATGQTAVGTYTYFVTQTSTVTACESPRDTVTLTINALPAAPAAMSDSAICYGDPTPDLTASGTNINWYDGAGNLVGTGSPFASGVTAPGTYTFVATQTNTVTACESFGDTVLLAINASAPPVAPDVAVCFGSPVPPLVASGTNIQWYDASMNPIFSGDTFAHGQMTVGTYTYYVTQTTTVTACASVPDPVILYISNQPLAPPAVANDTGCAGGFVPNLEATTGTIINWYSDAALNNLVYTGNPFATGLTVPGTYTFFAADSTPGCPEGPSDTVMLTIHPQPAAASASDTAVCFGMPVPDLIVSGTNITWYDTSLSIVSTNDTFATGVTAAGSYTYFVTQSDAVTGCESARDTVTLTIHALPSMPSALDTVVCASLPIPDLTATGTNVQWYNASWTLVFTGNSYATGQTAAGTYSYYVTEKDNSTGCESMADTAVLSILNAPPVPMANNVAVCFGNPVPALTSPGNNVTWYSDASLTTVVATGNIYNTGQTAIGVYTYWVTDSLAGCASSGADSVSLIINPAPAKPTANDTTLCYGTSAVLTSTGNNPQWYSDATLINMVGSGSPFNTGITAVGTYTYYAADYAAGCGNSPADTVGFTINPVPLVTANTYSTSIVMGNSITLTAYNAVSYSWAPGGQTSQSIVVSPTVATTYTVTGTNQYGCSSSITIVIQVNPLGVASLNEPVQGVNVYPNPAIGAFTVEFFTGADADAEVYMTNLIGERVRVDEEKEIAVSGGVKKYTFLINARVFTEGIYNVEIVTAKGTVTRRVVVFR